MNVMHTEKRRGQKGNDPDREPGMCGYGCARGLRRCRPLATGPPAVRESEGVEHRIGKPRTAGDGRRSHRGQGGEHVRKIHHHSARLERFSATETKQMSTKHGDECAGVDPVPCSVGSVTSSVGPSPTHHPEQSRYLVPARSSTRIPFGWTFKGRQKETTTN